MMFEPDTKRDEASDSVSRAQNVRERLGDRAVELAGGRRFPTERCQAWRVSPPFASAKY